jgi:hypothetical protein
MESKQLPKLTRCELGLCKKELNEQAVLRSSSRLRFALRSSRGNVRHQLVASAKFLPSRLHGRNLQEHRTTFTYAGDEFFIPASKFFNIRSLPSIDQIEKCKRL